MKVYFSSNTDLWSTPQEFYDHLHKEFKFTLDPCADDSNHKTEKYFTKEDNGLDQDWSGHTVFMNPPYGREIKQWMDKASKEDATVVCLVPSRTDTKWWHDYVIAKGAEVRFIKGRLKFGESLNNAPFPSALVIYRKDNKKLMDKLRTLIKNHEFQRSTYFPKYQPSIDETINSFLDAINYKGEK